MCDHCGAANELIPIENEVFYKECSCGHRLPKVPRYGRNELIALCPNHSPAFRIGKNAGKYYEMAIPIVGNTSTGKTAYLAAWTVYTQTQLTRVYSVNVSFPFQGGIEFSNECKKRFASGVNVERTFNRSPLGIGIDIVSINDSNNGLRAYFYDPAGEVFDPDPNTDSLSQFRYYDFMDGCLFLIDPFATPGLRDRYDTVSAGIAASDKSIEDSCEKFIRGLYDHHLARNEYHYAYCAVVITKADAFDLDSFIGDKAVREAMSEDPSLTNEDYEDVLSEICEQKLEAWGMGHVLQLLNEHFREVRCFSVSAFGHPPQKGIPFKPRRVELPILWILNKNRQNVLIHK
jgi:hypothetical protein